MKRKLAAALVATMLLLAGAAACAPATTTASTSASEDASSFREEKVRLPEAMTDVFDARVAEDGGLLVAARDAQRTRVAVFRQADDGAWAESFGTDGLAPAIDGGSFMVSCLMPDGSLLCGVIGSEEGLACYRVQGGSHEALPFSIEATVQRLVPHDDGTLFVDARTSLSRIDAATGEERCSYKLDAESYVSDFAVRDGVLYVIVSRGGADMVETAVQAFDVETGAPREVDPGLLAALESALPSKVAPGAASPSLIANGSDGLYVCAKGNVYRCEPGSAERVLAGDDTHLANSGEMPRKLVVQPDGGFAILYDAGAGSMTVRSMAYRYVKGARVEPAETIVVYALQGNADIQQAAATFRDEHPDIAVEVRTGIPADSGLSVDDALRSLNADLLAGTGPDVLVLDGLPLDQLAGQGMLRDISEDVRAVVADGSYYENVLGAFATDEGCFAVPTRFSVPAMVGDEEVLAQAGALEGLAAYLSATEESRSLLAPSTSASTLYLASRPALAGDDGKLHAEALASFFACTRQLLEMGEANLPGTADPSYDHIAHAVARLDGARSDARFAVGTIRDPKDFGTAGIGVANVDYACAWAPLAFGGARVFQPNTILGVSAGSDSPEAAGEFVAYLLGRSQQMRCASTGLPVSRDAFEEVVRACGGYAVGFGSDEGMKNYERAALSEDEIQACNRFLESATTACVDDKVETDAIAAGLSAYCLDGVSLEDAVEATMRKVSLYEAQ